MKYLKTYKLSLTVLLLFSLFTACSDDPASPNGNFTYVISADNTLKVSFVASGYGDYVEWDFGDGETSTSLRPVHTFPVGGDYTVKLSIYLENVNKPTVIDKIISLIDSPIPDFTYEKEYLMVSFTNTSTYATSYVWDFGDGENSTEENPMHTYAEPGEYTVTLTAIGVEGSVPGTVSETLSVQEKPFAPIDVLNGDFTLPGTADIIENWDTNPDYGDIPGWTSEGNQYDCGVFLYSVDPAVQENGSLYFAKNRNTDGPIYNLTDHVIASGEEFKINLDICDLYYGDSEFRLYYDTGDGTRHVFANKAVTPYPDAGNSNNWVNYELKAIAPSEAVGGKIGIEIQTTGLAWFGDGWAGVDNVTLFVR